jgi:hypothetical protein
MRHLSKTLVGIFLFCVFTLNVIRDLCHCYAHASADGTTISIIENEEEPASQGSYKSIKRSNSRFFSIGQKLLKN